MTWLVIVAMWWHAAALFVYSFVVRHRQLHRLPINRGTFAAVLAFWPVLAWELYRKHRWPHHGPPPAAWPALHVIQGGKR